MKRKLFATSLAIGTILTAGLTSYGVSKLTAGESTHQPAAVEYVSYGAGNHFTSYTKESYPDLTYAAENAVQAVVNIEKFSEVKNRRSYNSFFDFFGIPQESAGEQSSREVRSGGSGVIVSGDGYIVTNNHVIENASKIRVKLYDNRVFDGRVIGTDPETDIALIKIEATGLPTLPFGDSDELRLGEWVLAIGSPFDLRSTVTAGIVSAKARNLTLRNNTGIESFIQTDAAVNPGNSGGALVNTKGELVGINTVIKSPTGSFAGYSFAVPVSIVQKVIYDLREYGVVQRAYIGVTFREIDETFLEEEGEKYGISETGGALVVDVIPDGAAEAAGIKSGDIITEINGVKIQGSGQLLEEVAKHNPNDKIKVFAKRDNKVKQFDVVLRNKAGKAELLPSDYVDPVKALGGTFKDVSDKGKKEFKIKGGAVVADITEGGILSEAGIKRNFIITRINDRWDINSVNDLNKVSEKITRIEGLYPDGRYYVYSTR